MDQYKHVEKLIKKSRRVLIVSPYIDYYYADFILKHSRGKKIYIISSSLEKSAERLIKKGSFPSLSLLATTAFIISYLLLYELGIYYMPLLIIGILSFFIFVFRISRRKPRNIYLKIPKRFVHSKFYIGEDTAISGSANLTYRGMHSNIEHIEIRKDPEYIKELEKEFWRLWKEE